MAKYQCRIAVNLGKMVTDFALSPDSVEFVNPSEPCHSRIYNRLYAYTGDISWHLSGKFWEASFMSIIVKYSYMSFL